MAEAETEPLALALVLILASLWWSNCRRCKSGEASEEWVCCHSSSIHRAVTLIANVLERVIIMVRKFVSTGPEMCGFVDYKVIACLLDEKRGALSFRPRKDPELLALA
jgi:hypothetical protein